MQKTFEDEFVELQSGLISLCLELLESENVEANKIYVYCSNQKKSKSFNAFFEVNGEVKTPGGLKMPDELVFQFLKVGLDDLKNLDAICTQYGMPKPTEMKLIYDVRTERFEADYKYKKVCSGWRGKDPSQVFMEWVSEVRGNRAT